MALTTRTSRSWMSRMTWVPPVGSADADVAELAVHAQGDGAGLVDAVVADPVVGLGVPGGPGRALGMVS